ncbi:Flp pilus assembly protein CpaB [Pararhodobacter sp.]|uniref:Flp pilus assembly protein CpaB n=1 Tax=Pararhodobacter sp. TaxID=2127056 RepID=UPI002AFF8EE9|nr:Flp pilus assembly protein CpaB [Pararhodobacter sp.]
MRGVQIGILGIGLALAGFGVYMAQDYVSKTQAAMAAAQANNVGRPSHEVVQVLVAGRPLRYGEPIQVTDVRTIDWPANAVPPGAFLDTESLIPDPTRPRVALRAMEPMEPLLAVKVSEPGQPAGIAAMLTPGSRAFTIRVDQNSGISGTLRPSDTIDIYWTGRSENGEVTRLLSSSVRIIALDENADQDRSFNGVPRSITIEAEPEMIASLAQGQSTGRLSLSLVGLDDAAETGSIQVDARSLLGIEARVEQVTERCTVRTRRGSEVVMIEIPCTN